VEVGMNKHPLLGFVMMLVTLTTLPAYALVIDDGVVLSPSSFQVVDPTRSVAGLSQLTLSQQFWQWSLAIPADTNPLLDTTGAFANTNNGGPVFFVAGNTGGTSTRNFTVPEGKPIFFPIVAAFDAELPADVSSGACDLACAFGFIPYVAGATNLVATLDGQNLLTYPSYRQTSTSFFQTDVAPSLSAALGFPPAYAGVLETVSDGYWVAVTGLARGPHTLVFGGEFPESGPNGFSLHMTANINAVPEPNSAFLMLLGLGAVWAAFRRKLRLPRMLENAGCGA
jgi:hypothetical protein